MPIIKTPFSITADFSGSNYTESPDLISFIYYSSSYIDNSQSGSLATFRTTTVTSSPTGSSGYLSLIMSDPDDVTSSGSEAIRFEVKGGEPRVGIGFKSDDDPIAKPFEIKTNKDNNTGTELVLEGSRKTTSYEVGDELGKIAFVANSASFDSKFVGGEIATLSSKVDSVFADGLTGRIILGIAKASTEAPQDIFSIAYNNGSGFGGGFNMIHTGSIIARDFNSGTESGFYLLDDSDTTTFQVANREGQSGVARMHLTGSIYLTQGIQAGGILKSQDYFAVSRSGDFTDNEFLVANGAGGVESTDALAVSASNLGIGVAKPEVRLHMLGEAPQTTQILMEQFNDTADAPDIRTRRYRGTSASRADVQAGDYLFRFNVHGQDGGSSELYGSMQFDVDSSDQDALNWRIQTRDTTGTNATRLTIDKDGDVDIVGQLAINGFSDVSASLATIPTNAVSTTGTPADNQLAIFTDSSTIEGDSNITWNGSTFTINGTGSVDLLQVDDRLQGNGSGFQFFAFNEDTVKVKFANWYSSNDHQYGMGMLWYETWFGALEDTDSGNDRERRIGFYLETPNSGSTDSVSGVTGAHPTNARAYVDVNGMYISGTLSNTGSINSSGNITTTATGSFGRIEIDDTIQAANFTGSFLRLDQNGNGFRMTNRGAFEADGTDFKIFATNTNLKLASDGSSGTRLTLNSTKADFTVPLDVTGDITASGKIADSTYPSDNLLNLQDDNVVNANGVTLSSIGSTVFMIDSNNSGTSDKFEFRADSRDAGAGTLLATIEDNGDFTAEGDISASGDMFCNNITVAEDITSVGDDIILKDNLAVSSSGGSIQFRGTAGGSNESITYLDSGGSGRFAMLFPGSDVVAITNRASNGTVEIRANSSTAGSGGEVTVAEFQDDLIKLNVAQQRLFEVTSTTDGDGNGDYIKLGSTATTAGKIYYYNSSGNWVLTDADAASSSTGLIAVAMSNNSGKGMLLKGMVTLDHDPGTVGDILYLSTTSGQATSTSPSGTNDIVRVIGYCLNSTNGQIYFDPSKDHIVHD
jgi:hypothetical protein